MESHKKATLQIMLAESTYVPFTYVGSRFWVRKIFQERNRYGLYHILTNDLRLFDKEYFFRFVRMTPQRFEHLLSLVGPPLQRITT